MESHLREREHLLATAAPGLDSARSLSALTDSALVALAERAPAPRGRWAVCALGGWGAGALLPASDLDVLVLSDASERELEPFVEAMLYPLWDAGFSVGHQVRSPKGHLRACRSGKLETLTASLTGRVLAGDAELGRRTLADVAHDARRRSRAVLRSLAERPRPGSPYLLEPQLKEGAGGRRDHDELVWTAAVIAGATADSPQALVEAGLLSAGELGVVLDACEVVAAARWELQRAGHGDRLDLDAVDALTTNPEVVQHALATTWTVLNRVRRRVVGATPCDEAPLDPDALRALVERGEDAFDEFAEAAQVGCLDALVPGVRELMTVRRPGLAHTLTVGAHCVRAATALAGLRHGDGPLARSASLVTDADALLVATLVHDAGKIAPGPGHAERGVPVAADVADALGLSEESRRTAGELVAHHLTLVETALREDLDDEEVILRCAARIGRRELIAPLHVLTAADTMATGPSAWTPWFGTMLAELVTRLDAALSPHIDGAGLVTRAETVRADAIARADGDTPAIRTFLEAAPTRYLSARTPAEAVGDARLVSGLAAVADAEPCRIAVGVGPTLDTHVVTVAARDRPFLLSRLAGAFSLAGLDILAFDAYGTTGRIALDTFTVTSATARPLTPEVFARLERLLAAALTDRYELATRLAERRRHYPPRDDSAPRIEIAPGGWDTTVRVRTPDRPGLLHDLASAVSATGLDIRRARARTIEGLADDSFHVVGADGGPVDDPGVLGHLTMRLREAL